MKLTIFANYLNHHQVLVTDCLFDALGDNFRFVTTLTSNPEQMKGGGDFSNRVYCICAADDIHKHSEALRLAVESDVCVFGADSISFAIERAKRNPKGISFEMGERWLKRGWVNVLSPHFLKWWLSYLLFFRKANFYRLCSSAFASLDMKRLRAYKGRCYKWGYFTEVDVDFNFDEQQKHESDTDKVLLMWCARFLKWKHPELPIYLAKRLKDDHYKFSIRMYGSGSEFESTKQLAKFLDVDDVVVFMGNKPNSEILKAMREHDIFLFTSDRNEGWGAVANESMSNGCVLVGSDEIGSVPYLVENHQNGVIFKSCNLDSLYSEVKFLLDSPKDRCKLSRNAVQIMKSIWSPASAANNLLSLIGQLREQQQTTVLKGPCSIA